MEISATVNGQELKIPSSRIAPRSQQFVCFNFNLSKDWTGLKTFAQFKQNGVAYNQYLDNNNSAYLPSEITEGECTLMLYGSYGNVIATTNYVTLYIYEDIFKSDGQSVVISTSLYNQLVTEITDLTARVKTLEEKVTTQINTN